MTRERVKELLPVFKAYADGKTIQSYSEYYGKWIDLDGVHFKDDTQYRVKEKKHCYPYDDEEKCKRCVHYNHEENNCDAVNCFDRNFFEEK